MTSTGENYVLMTAARNEAAYIEGTIKAVLSQTVKPRLWVIVSDGSTDGTDEIIRGYEKNAGFVVYLRRNDPSSKADFRRKVESLRLAQAMFNRLSYDFIGNLDADITFPADYFEILLHEFSKTPGLGIAGGVLYEPINGRFVRRYLSEERYVPGAVQFFRRECYEQVGGYLGLRRGGEDTVAVVSARMKGWKTLSVQGLPAFHHKVGSKTGSALRGRFREAAMFYCLGSDPLFEILKSLRWMGRRPYFLQGIARLCGYVWAVCHDEKPHVSMDFIRYLRQEQRKRLREALKVSPREN